MKKLLIIFLIASFMFFAIVLALNPTPFLVSISSIILGFNTSLCLSVFVGAAIQQKHLAKIETLEKDHEEFFI